MKTETTPQEERRMASMIGLSPNDPSSWPNILPHLARFQKNESSKDFREMCIWLMRLMNA